MTAAVTAFSSPETPPRPGALLTARGLVKRYGRDTAVNGVDLDIGERGFITLLGPSGCGKTTILRMIAGFEMPDEGTMVLDGRSLIGVPPEHRPVNTVFQSYALFPHLTVYDNVAFAFTLRHRGEDYRPKVLRALEAVHMVDFADRYPHQLSGGQQQRVAVARAIVAEPYMLLLDEPLSALDAKMRAHLQIELKDLQRRLKIAFLFVTHDQEEAFALSDQIVVMNKGRIMQQSDPQTLYARPANAFVADFIGAGSLIPGRLLTPTQEGRAVIETTFGAIPAPAREGQAKGDASVLVVRPAHLTRDPAGTFATATVTHVIFKGNGFLVEVTSAGETLRYQASEAPAPGETVRLALAPERAFITAGNAASDAKSGAS